MTPALLLGGLGMLAGSAGMLLAAWRAPRVERPAQPSPDRRRAGASSPPARVPRAMVAGAMAALITAVATRWPVAALLAGAGAAGVPSLLESTRGGKETVRIEAVAAWTELLRDTMAAAAGLGQAIVATAELAPRPIRVDVVALAERLMSGVATEDALRAFAADLDDPSADLVVCALLVAATAQSQRLTELLGALADSCRAEVAMRLRIEASRASSRSSVRTVVVFSVAFAVLLFVLAHAYLAPFGTVTGQVVLVAVGALYASGLVLMVRLARPRPGVRLLAGGTEG